MKKITVTRHASLLSAACLLFLSTTAGAQGSDSCSTAQLIAGTGTFNFSTTTATTDGHPEGVLGIPGLRQIENDVWFRWVAPSTAVYEITTDFINQTDGATVVAIYRYGCASGPGRAIAGKGLDAGSLFTTFDFGTDADVEYLIRIGNTVSQNNTSGLFSLTEVSPPATLDSVVYPGNGRTYHFLEPSSWTVAQAAAQALGGNLVTVNDQAEQDWLQQTFHNWNGQARSFWLGYNDAAVEGTFVWVSGETPGYENWTGAPNNGNQYEHYAHFRHDHANGTWNDLIGFPGAGFFYNAVHGVVEIDGESADFCNGDGGDQMGCTDCPCGNNAAQGTIGGCLNSALSSTRLNVSGSDSISAADLRIEASGAPPSVSAVLTSGNAQAPANMANPCFGMNSGIQSVNLDGLRCAVQNVLRHGVRPSDTNGDIGVTTNGWGTPNGFFNFSAFSAGQTKHFQIIYRDDDLQVCQTGQNTSQGRSVTFQL